MQVDNGDQNSESFKNGSSRLTSKFPAVVVLSYFQRLSILPRLWAKMIESDNSRNVFGTQSLGFEFASNISQVCYFCRV